MQITLDQLKTFLWVARLGGVRRAAEQMNVSQPAVSARISTLEQVICAKLFDRTPSGVVLTKKGHLLQAYAERIVLSLEEIREFVIEPDALEDLLRIGVSETIGQSWLADFLARMNSAYPRISVEVTVDISLNLREMLLARGMDLAILMGPVSEFTVDNLALPPFEVSWFRAVSRKEVDLASTPVISYARQTRPYRELRMELTRRYGPGARIFPTSSMLAGFQMVVADLGVGALPRALAMDYLETQQIVEFDPGWTLAALNFTASFLAEPKCLIAERAAQIALEAATDYAARTSSVR
ncbi:MAG: LysR family transcriptional regulator [Rhodomicrobiaceae bacterium]